MHRAIKYREGTSSLSMSFLYLMGQTRRVCPMRYSGMALDKSLKFGTNNG